MQRPTQGLTADAALFEGWGDPTFADRVDDLPADRVRFVVVGPAVFARSRRIS